MKNISEMNKKYVLMGLFVSIFIGCACADALEFSGEVVQLKGTQTTDLIWDENNFGGFCCDTNGSVGTETLTIAADTLTGPDIDRTIETNALIYTTSSIWREYELHKNLGLTVESDYYGGDTGYWIEFWMGERYVAIDGKSNKLAKLLVELNGTDTKTLVTGEPWNLSGGFVLEAKQINIGGDRVQISLCKNGKEIDSKVIGTWSSDMQERVYTYTEDVAGEYNIPIFSCYISGIMCGTDFDYIQVKYVFLIDNDILQISTGDYYNNMEVVVATPSQITLENWKNLYLRQYPPTCHIMGNLSFETISNNSAIEFYPYLIRNELPVLHGDVEFISDSYWCSWDIADGYVLTIRDIDFDGDEVWLELSKDGNAFKGIILEQGDLFEYRTGLESVDCVVDAVFKGALADVVKLKNINQYSSTGAQLINNESKTHATTDPIGEIWACWEEYSLAPKDIDMRGDKVWLSLLKGDLVVRDEIIDSRKCDADRWFKYYNATGALVFSTYVDMVFRGTETALVQLKHTNQYSEIDGRLFIEPSTESWQLQEGYYLTAQEIYDNNSVWLQLSKNNKLVDESLFYNNSFYLQNSTAGQTIVSGTISNYEHWADSVVQLTSITQYHEATGIVLAAWTSKDLLASWSFKNDKKILSTPYRVVKTWTVDTGGGADYTSIQAAINAAIPGDTIYVHAGTYGENVDVNKRITLKGEGADVVTVEAVGAWDHVFEVTASWVNITGFTLRGATHYFGIYLNNANNCNVSDNIASNNVVGIGLDFSSNNTLQNNTASNNDAGILLYSSSNNMITSNNASNNNDVGISLNHWSSSNILCHNNLINNTQNAYDECTNQWDSGIEGNYWSNYTGTDSNHNGIIDTPYSIPGGNSTDRYPLMQPWIPPLKGDPDGNGEITTADVIIALQLAVRGEYDNAADISSDGKVTSLDAFMILQMATGGT